MANRILAVAALAFALAGCGILEGERPDVDPAYQAAVEREAYRRMPPGAFQQPRLPRFLGGLGFLF